MVVNTVHCAGSENHCGYITMPPPPPVFSHLPHNRPQPLFSPVLTAPSTHRQCVDSQV